MIRVDKINSKEEGCKIAPKVNALDVKTIEFMTLAQHCGECKSTAALDELSKYIFLHLESGIKI